MMDMSAVITPKSDQINADDLIGGPMTITIRSVDIKGGQEQPVSISFDGSGKVFRPCKSMSRVLVAAWGADAKAYIGRSLTLYRDPKVKWGGMEIGGIRISHMSHLDRQMTLALTVTKGKRDPYVIKQLETQRAQVNETAIHQEAREAASYGTETFGKWWKAHPDWREACRPILDELKATCDRADAAGVGPFAPDATPDPADLARAEAEAMAAIRAQEVEG
jgi:hypothetical protein